MLFDEWVLMAVMRIDLAQEALVWRKALDHLGQTGLFQVVVDLWMNAGPPAKQTVEYLEANMVGQAVLDIVREAQKAVGASVPFRESSQDRIILFSLHAQHLTHGLLHRLPMKKLPRPLQVLVLENDMGV